MACSTQHIHTFFAVLSAILVSLKHKISATSCQGFSFPEEWTAVAEYIKLWDSRDSWKNTYYSPELIIEGWKKHLVKA